MSYAPETRASDDDRERIAGRLQTAHTEGRLSTEELHTRLDATYRARVYGDLEPLVRDLPAERAAPQQGPPVSDQATAAVPARRRSRGDQAMRVAWGVWASVVAINVVIWVLVSVTNMELTYFWPAWVAGPWGAVLVGVEVVRRQV